MFFVGYSIAKFRQPNNNKAVFIPMAYSGSTLGLQVYFFRKEPLQKLVFLKLDSLNEEVIRSKISR